MGWKTWVAGIIATPIILYKCAVSDKPDGMSDAEYLGQQSRETVVEFGKGVAGDWNANDTRETTKKIIQKAKEHGGAVVDAVGDEFRGKASSGSTSPSNGTGNIIAAPAMPSDEVYVPQRGPIPEPSRDTKVASGPQTQGQVTYLKRTDQCNSEIRLVTQAKKPSGPKFTQNVLKTICLEDSKEVRDQVATLLIENGIVEP